MKIICDSAMDEARARPLCEWCQQPRKVDSHHLFGRGLAGGSRIDAPWSLISLCRECHDLHHAGHRPIKVDLLAIVAERCSCLQGDLESAKDAVLLLDKGYTDDDAVCSALSDKAAELVREALAQPRTKAKKRKYRWPKRKLRWSKSVGK